MRHFLFLFPLLFVLACGTPKTSMDTVTPPTPVQTYAGSWDFTVEDTPLGTVAGVLTLTETDGKLGGNLNFDGTEYPLKTTKAADGVLTTSFFYADQGLDVPIRLNGLPADGTLTGWALGEYKATAVKK